MNERPALPPGCDRPLPLVVQAVVVPGAVIALLLFGALVASVQLAPTNLALRVGIALAWFVAVTVHMFRIAPGRGLSRPGIAAGIVVAGAAVAAGLNAGA